MADISKIKLPNGTEYDIKDSGALPLTGGTITGPVIFQDTTSMDEATIGDLVVNGNASFTNNIQANIINGVTVGSSPKFTDTITTATTTGSGNAVTAITASNGALTITKDTTFLTSHQDISGKADKATTLAGYGITDAKISSGTITLGSNTITPLTSSSTLNAAKLSGAIPSAVTATTQSASDNSTKIATTAFVQAAMSSAGAGTVTSVGVSNATNGGLSISGSPITSNGTITIGHSNILTSAQTTQAVYPIKIDKNGHISEYGSAVTIPTKVSDLTNDSGFVTTDEKLKIDKVLTDYNVYFPIIARHFQTADAIEAAQTRYYDNGGFEYGTSTGTANDVGVAKLILGNNIASGTAGNKLGQINIFGQGSNYHTIVSGASSSGSQRLITLPDKSGTIALTDDIPTVPSNIVNTITTTAGAHTAITNQKGNVSFSIPTTAAHVGAAASDHTHGNITNGGDITATAPTIANGDQIIINDNSASKITNGPTFDGSTTTTALTPKGTWETFLKSYTETDPVFTASAAYGISASDISTWNSKSDFSGDYDDLTNKPTIPENTSDLNNDSNFVATDASGNMSLGGVLTLESHQSEVGWYGVKSDTISKASGTAFGSISGSAATLSKGRWLIIANARYAGATSGNRGVAVYQDGTIISRSQVIVPAISSTSWTTSLITSVFVELSSSQEFKIGLLQNSGNGLSTSYDMYYIRVR